MIARECFVRIYIAARFSRRPEANALARALQKKGHVITSRWVKPDSDHVVATGLSQQAADSERRRFAIEDVEEPRSNSRGGRHVEFGMAVALKHRLTIIGPRETVFHHLPEVEYFGTVEEFLNVY
jgi:hypothetical protein